MRIKHQQSFIKTLKEKIDIEEKLNEEVEVAYYTQTILKAQNDDKIDQVFDFIEEFAKRLRTETTKENYSQIRDANAFN